MNEKLLKRIFDDSEYCKIIEKTWENHQCNAELVIEKTVCFVFEDFENELLKVVKHKPLKNLSSQEVFDTVINALQQVKNKYVEKTKEITE